MRKILLAAVVAALLLFGGVAVAQTDVVRACASTQTGALRLAVGGCKNNEQSITWNVRGQDGVSGYEIVKRTFEVADFGTAGYTVDESGDPGGWTERVPPGPAQQGNVRAIYWVLCPPGKVAVSGGMEGRGWKGRGFGEEWPATDRWVVKNLHPEDVGNNESMILDVYATCVGTPG